MKRTTIAVAAMGLATMMIPLGAPAIAKGQSNIIQQLFDKANEIYSGKGYSATGWSYQSSLKQGGTETMSVPLTGGSTYSLVGACDTSCSNLDIHLFDSSGKEVDSDLEADDFPIVAANASGTYTIQVVMTACNATPCAYGVKAFRK